MALDQNGREISIGDHVKRTRFVGWSAEKYLTNTEVIVTNVRSISIEFVINGNIMVGESRNFTVVDKRPKKVVL